jgi:hypothetical protein
MDRKNTRGANRVASEDPAGSGVMIAVDESENSLRAVRYVAKILAGRPGVAITIVHVLTVPDDDYFSS